MKILILLSTFLFSFTLVKAQNKNTNKTVKAVKITSSQLQIDETPKPKQSKGLNSTSKTYSKNSTNSNVPKLSQQQSNGDVNSVNTEREYMQNIINSKYKIKDSTIVEKKRKEMAEKSKQQGTSKK